MTNTSLLISVAITSWSSAWLVVEKRYPLRANADGLLSD